MKSIKNIVVEFFGVSTVLVSCVLFACHGLPAFNHAKAIPLPPIVSITTLMGGIALLMGPTEKRSQVKVGNRR